MIWVKMLSPPIVLNIQQIEQFQDTNTTSHTSNKEFLECANTLLCCLPELADENRAQRGIGSEPGSGTIVQYRDIGRHSTNIKIRLVKQEIAKITATMQMTSLPCHNTTTIFEQKTSKIYLSIQLLHGVLFSNLEIEYSSDQDKQEELGQ